MIVLWISLLLLVTVSLSQNHSCYPSLELNIYLPPIRIIRNSSDPQMADLSCLLHCIGHVVEVFETDDRPCIQLLTLPAEPYELDVLMIRAEVNLPLCEPRVYGPLPRVLQARFAPENINSFGPKNIVSFQLNNRGGHLLFDMDLDREHDLVAVALKNILELVEVTRFGDKESQGSKQQSFKNFQRTEDLYANPVMTKEVFDRKYKRRNEISPAAAIFFAILSIPLIIFASFAAFFLMWNFEEEESERSIKEAVDITQIETEPLIGISESTSEKK